MAGIATNRPMTVAMSAPATPGAIAVRLAALRFGDAGKSFHDAPDRPEQSDERPAGHGRGENDHALFQRQRLLAGGAFEGDADGLERRQADFSRDLPAR